MDISRVRSAMAETCRNVWNSQMERRLPTEVEELTPVETQALVLAVIDGRAGVEVSEEEMERVLEAAAEAKRVWRRLETAMLGLAGLRFDGDKLQIVMKSTDCKLGGVRTAIQKADARFAAIRGS